MNAKSTGHYETPFQSSLNFLGFRNSVEFELLITKVEPFKLDWSEYEGSCYFLLQSFGELVGQLWIEGLLLDGRFGPGDGLVDHLLGRIGFSFALLTFGLLIGFVLRV